MDFLYRMPLVDFDPSDKDQIEKNWNWIKKAIQLSSASLFEMIASQDFDSLPISIQTKIQKYLLRGRYRPTPFGLWAGVGLGKWTNDTEIELPITYKAIDEENNRLQEKKIKETGLFKSAPCLKAYSNQVQYWSYCPQGEGWRLSYLDKNKLVVILLDYFAKFDTLNFKTFKNFFKTTKSNTTSNVWAMLIESGILIPASFPDIGDSSTKSGLDIRINSNLSLKPIIRDKLDCLISEIGNLFVPVESDYINEFKGWFSYNFDDRFVPLSILIRHNGFLNSVESGLALNKTQDSPSPKVLNALWNQAVEFDLSSCFEQKKTELNHIQLAFRIFENDELFIDNVVCNRPFAYSGRFSLDHEIKEFLSTRVETHSSDTIYADLVLFESTKSNHITRHGNVFEFSIYPFGKSTKKNHLGIDDLYIGLIGNRLILYSKQLKKPVMPIVQHPLNPNQISHPLSRLLWEIGNQDQHRFLPYHDPAFQSSEYLPRLTWKGIILQGRKWILTFADYSSKNDLLHFFQESNFPSPIVAGHLDRELLLDWREPLELDIFWQEFRRLQEMTVFECPWKGKSPFKDQSGQQLYPQVIYSANQKNPKTPSIDFLNPIDSVDDNWIYLRIGIREEGLIPFFIKSFPAIILDLKTKFFLQKWYFLNYNSPKSEIRLRLLARDPRSNQKIIAEVSKSLNDSGWISTVLLASYYPEFEKYSLPGEGMIYSESIFHKESELVLLGDSTNAISPILTWNEPLRIKWIIDTYYHWIVMADMQKTLFRYYQELLKKIPGCERKELSYRLLEVGEIPSSHQKPEFFNSEFFRISKEPEKVLLKILPNHLHMSCNRAFPSDTAHHERLVIYGLYKKLGKSIYGRLINL